MSAPKPLLDVARRLGVLRDRVVFVGGMIRTLLITDPAACAARATDDVDLIVDVPSPTDHLALNNQLRELGFQECTDKGAPTCRWVVEDIRADVMPVDPAILGFSNAWYAGALASAASVTSPSGDLRILNAPVFIATKLEAFASRGKGDYLHHDLEDVIAVVDGRAELIDELRSAPPPLRRFVAAEIARLLADGSFMEILPGHLEGDDASQARLPLLKKRLAAIAALAQLPARKPLGSHAAAAASGASGDVSARQLVRSSSLRSVAYEPTTRVLTVEFQGGRIYGYDDVPAAVYEGLLSSPSKGRYHHRYIRQRYRFRRVR